MCNPRLFCSKNNLHNDPLPSDQYLFALNQLFADNNTPNKSIVCNTNSYYTSCGANTVEALNCENYWGHCAGYLPQGNPTMNVYNTNHYSLYIDTNIHIVSRIQMLPMY